MIDVRLALTDSPPPGNLPIKIRCMIHDGDNTPSMCVYPDGLHCFGCGFHTIRAQESISVLLGKRVEDVSRYESSKVEAYRDKITQETELDPLPYSLAGVYNIFLMTGSRRGRLEWLLERGLTTSTVSQYLLGHDGTRFTIPIYNKRGDLISFRYRRDDAYGLLDYHENEISKYVGYHGRNGLFIYPAHEMFQDTRDYVVVCEGELDALRLRQEGINACSPTGGIGSFKHVPLHLQSFRRIRKVYVAADMDEPGYAGAAELMEVGRSAGYEMTQLAWNDQHKDITELYKAGGTIEQDIQ